MPKLYRRSSLFAILLLVMLVVTPAAQAAEPRSGQDVVIPASETVNDDVYLFGQTVTIDGTIKGDAVALGQTVVVNGTVEGSLMTAGSTVTINGRVGHSVRAGAYAIHLMPESSIGKDVVVGAFSLIADPSSQVQGDVWAGSYQAGLNGEIGRDYHGSQVALEINGIIHGNVNAQVDTSNGNPINPAQFMPNDPNVRAVPVLPPGLRVGDKAQIGGALNYTSSVPGTISPNANIASGVQMRVDPSVERNRQAALQAQAEANSPVTQLLNFVRNVVTLLVIGCLLIWLARSTTERAATTAMTRPLPSFGWGLVTLVTTPVVGFLILAITLLLMGILALMTLGGLGTAALASGLVIGSALLLVFVMAVAWVSKVIVGIALGRLLLARTSPSLMDSWVWPLVLGVSLIALVVAVLNLLPGLGALVNLVVAILGIGALAIGLWESWRGGPFVVQPIAAPIAPTPVELPSPT